MKTPPPGPRDHTIRSATTQGGASASLTTGRSSTIGKTMAKVKDFMAGSGITAIKDFGAKITGDYALDIFPQAGNGFLIEVGGKSLHVTSRNADTAGLEADIQSIWDNIHGASVHGSDSPALTSSATHLPLLSSRAGAPLPPLPPSPASSVLGGGRSSSALTASSFRLDEEDAISPEARAKADAINYHHTSYGSLDFRTPIGANLSRMWQAGKNVLDDSPLAPHFSSRDHDVLRSSNNRGYDDQMLDLFLLDDMAKQIELGRFSEAAVSYSLLTDLNRNKLNNQLDPRIPVLMSSFPHCGDEIISTIADAFKRQTPASLARKLESVQGSIRLEAFKVLASIRSSQTQQAHAAQVAQLQGQIQHLQAQVSWLRTFLSQVGFQGLGLIQQLTSKTQELERLQAAYAALSEAKARELDEASDRYTHQTKSLVGQIRRLQSILERVSQQRDAALERTCELKAANKELKAQLRVARLALEASRISIAEKQAALDAAAVEKAGLKARIEALNTTVNEKLSALGSAEGLALSSDNLPAKLGILIAALDRQIALTEAEQTAKDAAQAEARELAGQLASLRGENTRVSAALSTATEGLASAQDANRALAARVEQLTLQNQTLNEALAAATLAKDAAAAKAEALTRALAEQGRTIDGYRKSLAAAQEETRLSREAQAATAAKLSEAEVALEAQARRHSAALADMTTQLRDAESARAALELEHADLSRRHTTQTRSLEDLKAELATVKDQKAAAIAALDITSASLTQRVKEAQGLRAALATRDETIGRIEPLLNAAQAQKKRDDVEIARLQAEIVKLVKANQESQAFLTRSLYDTEAARTALFLASRQFEADLTRVIAHSKGVNDTLASQLAAAKARITELSSALEAEGADKARIQRDLTQELARTAKLAPELKAANEALAESQTKLAAAERRNEELSQANMALNAANATLIRDHAEAIRGINARHLDTIASLEAKQRDAILALTSSKDAELRAQADRILALEEQMRGQSGEIAAEIGKLKAIALSLGIDGAAALNNMTALDSVITPALAALKERKDALELEVPRLTEARDDAVRRLAAATASFEVIEAELREQIGSLGESNAAQASRLEEQLEEIIRLKAELSKRTGSLYKSIISGASLASKLQKAETTIAARDVTISEQAAALASLRERLGDLEIRAGENEATIAGALREKAQIQARLDEMTLRASTGDRALEDRRSEIARLQGALGEKERLISELSATFKKANTQLQSQIGAQKAALLELQADMASRMREAQGTLSTLAGAFRAKNDALVASLEDVARENAARADEIATLRPLADELTRLQAALAPSSLSSPDAITAHLAAFADLESKQAAFTRVLGSFGETPALVKAKIDSQDEIIASLRRELEEARETISSQDATILDLRSELAASKRAFDEAKAAHLIEISALSASKDAAISSLDLARRQFETTLGAKDASSSLALSGVRAELGRKTEAAEALARENDDLRAELERLRAQLGDSSAQNAALQKEVKEAKAATFEAKIKAFVEKRALKEKAKALSLWRLQALESKHEKEKGALEAQVAGHLATIGTLTHDHAALIGFLKSQLKADDILDPKKNELDALIEAFTKRLKAQERQVAESTEALAHADATLGVQRVALSTQEEALAGLRSELAARDVTISRLEAASAVAASVERDLRAAIEEARRTKAADDASIGSLTEQLRAAIDTNSRLTQDLAASRAQVGGVLEPGLRSAEEALASKQRQLEALTLSHGQLTQAHTEQSLELAKTKASCAALEKANTDLIRDHEREIARLTQENTAAIRVIQERLDTAELGIRERDAIILGLRDELAALKGAFLSEKATLLRDHEAELARLGSSSTQEKDQLIAQHQLALAQMKAKHDGILAEKESAIEAGAIALVSLQEKHQALVKLQAATVALLEKAGIETAALSGDRDALLRDKADLNLALADLTRQFQDQALKLSAQEAAASAETRALTEANGRLEVDIASLLASFEMPADSVASAIAKIQAQGAKIRALSAQVEEKTGALSRLSDASTREAAGLQEEIAGLQRALAEEKGATAAVNIRNQEALSSLLTKLARMQDVIPEAGAILERVQAKLSSRTGTPLNMAELLHDLEPIGESILEKIADIQSAHTLEMGLKTATLGKLQAALTTLRDEHVEIQRQLGVSTAAIAALQAKLLAQEEASALELTEASERFQSTLRDLKTGKEEIIQGHLRTIASLTEANRDASTEIDKLRALNAVLASQVEEANRRKDQAQAASTSALAGVCEELRAQKEFSASLQSTNNLQAASIVKKQEEITGLSRQIVEAKAHAAELAGELAKLQPAHTELLRQFDLKEAELAALKKAHSALLASAAGDADALARSQERIDELAEAQRASALLLEAQAAQIRDLIAANEALTSEQSERAAALLELRGQFDDLRGKAAATSLELDAARAENRGLQARIHELEPAIAELRHLREECAALDERNRDLEEEKAEAEAGGKAALEAKRAAQEQLRASLELARQLFEEALPKSAYGRFDSLFHNHLGALGRSLEDPRDLDRRISAALKAALLAETKSTASSGVSAPVHVTLARSCAESIVITSLPFADDRRVLEAGGGMDHFVAFKPTKLLPEFPVALEIKDPVTRDHVGKLIEGFRSSGGKGAGATARGGGGKVSASSSAMAEFVTDCKAGITSAFQRQTPSMGKARASLAHNVGSMGGGARSLSALGGGGLEAPDLASVSALAASDVGKLLSPESVAGSRAIEHLFDIFMDNDEIKFLLFRGHAPEAKAALQARMKAAAQACDARKAEERARATAALAGVRGSADPKKADTEIRAAYAAAIREIDLGYQHEKDAIIAEFTAGLTHAKAQRKARLQAELEALQAPLAAKEKEVAEAQAALEADSRGSGGAASMASRGSREEDAIVLALEAARSAHKHLVYEILNRQEELQALEAYDSLLAAHVTEEVIFTALNQRFSKNAPYFEEGSPQQTAIDQIVNFVTHRHIDKLLNLIMRNKSLAQELCVRRIVVGAQMLGHSQQEKLELNGALKSGFTLLNLLSSAILNRIMTGR